LVILFAASIASGGLNILKYEAGAGFLYRWDDRDTGQWVAENTPPKGIFEATNSEVMIPPAVYAGRPLFVGYLGWISSHGLVNATRERLTYNLELGAVPWSAREHNVDYLMKLKMDPKVRFCPVDEQPWWNPVMRIGQYEIWRLDWEPETKEEETGPARKTKRPKKTKRPTPTPST
jgi:hypothetical protein